MNRTLVWFRRDLRLADHPALVAALRDGDQVVPVYVHAPEEEQPWVTGAASRWWLHHSLAALAKSLAEHGSRLILRAGPSVAALVRLAEQTGATRVYWTRGYEPAVAARDRTTEDKLTAAGLECRTFGGTLLFEPWSVSTKSGTPFRVFTPFWRTCLRRGLDTQPSAPAALLPPVPKAIDSLTVDALGLLPTVAWDSGFYDAWRVGEAAAHERLSAFLEQALTDYPEARDLPGTVGTTRLSPHLHFGEISPRQIAAAVQLLMQADTSPGIHAGAEVLLRELGWREFAHHVLHHFPHTTDTPLDARFAGFPWREDAEALLQAWKRGQTGMPIVDAGMRELWHTGWMHNRVRMIVASFLTKNCRIPWQTGARWFWDTLVDADLANNSLNWQWVAGCGADAAPYFRIFNPVRQSEKFDPEGAYLRRWVPELADLPDRWLHRPWEASSTALNAAGLVIGRDYPSPVVDLKTTREEALAAFRATMDAARVDGAN